jgi:formate dehydrogenase subunit gamma
MTGFFSVVRMAVLAFIVAIVAGLTVPAFAQQPTTVNPTASSVTEDQLFQALKPGETIQGRATIPDPKAPHLIKPGGRDWTAFHQGTMHWIGGIAILGLALLTALFWFSRGRIMIDAGPSKFRILRFNTVERFAHWLSASTFLILAITGLNITFGKFVLLPLIGADAFTWFSQWGKYAHNYLSFPFMLGVVLMFLLWVKDNIPTGVDMRWFAEGGGILKKGHPPAKKFNGGQKIIFWSVILGGVALSVTGLMLLFPFTWAPTMAGMQLSQIIHGLVGMVLIAIMIGHIYIGSVGMEGAFDAMGSGEVDLNWAREHHSLWVAEEAAKGHNAIPKGAIPAE